MAEPKIRAFLAIRLDDILIKELGDFVEQIQPKYPQFRFLPPDNWHLTLHFFGSISTHEIDLLLKALPEITANIQPFSILLKGLGSFPGGRKSRILWIGAGEIDRLVQLKEQLDRTLLKIKFSAEMRPFHPHITIARSKIPVICQISNEEKNIQFEQKSRVEKITLFQSDLSSRGPRYTPLHDFYLSFS